MQSEHDLEFDLPYDPDDWGAPLPTNMPKTLELERALSGPSSGSLTPQASGQAANPFRENAALEMAHAAAAHGAPRNGEPAESPPAGPGRRRRGPARVAAGGPGLALPHAAKPDLFPALFSRSALFRVSGADDTAITPSATRTSRRRANLAPKTAPRWSESSLLPCPEAAAK